MGGLFNGSTPLIVQNSEEWLENDGQWSTFDISVGTPPQHFQVLPSFHERIIHIPRVEDRQNIPITACDDPNSQFKSSLGFKVNDSSTWQEIGVRDLEPGPRSELEGTSLYGYDDVGIPSVGGSNGTVTIERQVVDVYSTQDTPDLPETHPGRFGLSTFNTTSNNTETATSFLRTLKQKGFIPSLSFGYQAGAAYRNDKVHGSLVLGGYDQSRKSSNSVTIPLTTDIVVGVQSITATLQHGSVTLLNPGILAVLDTTVPELWLPHNVCDQIATVLNLTYNNESDRYTLTEPAHNTLQSLNGTLQFRIGADPSSNPSIRIDVPYKALTLNPSSPPIPNTQTRYFPLRRATNPSQYALGRAFLQEAYLVVDWERQSLELSQAIFANPMPLPTIVAIQPNTTHAPPVAGESDLRLSAGAIAGIAVGVAACVMAVAVGVWVWRRRGARGRAEDTGTALVSSRGRRKGQSPSEPFLHGRHELEAIHVPVEGWYGPPKRRVYGGARGVWGA